MASLMIWRMAVSISSLVRVFGLLVKLGEAGFDGLEKGQIIANFKGFGVRHRERKGFLQANDIFLEAFFAVADSLPSFSSVRSAM